MNRIILLIIVVLITQCSPKTETQSTSNISCEKCNEIASQCFFNFSMTNDTLSLDSSLSYIELGLSNSCDSFAASFVVKKLQILSIKKEFSQALEFISKLDKDLFSNPPYYMSLLNNRFLAMNSAASGDLSKRNYYLKKSINEINTYISISKMDVDSMLILPDVNEILSSDLITAYTQFYYYRSIVEGYDKISGELDSLEAVSNGNSEFFEYMDSVLEMDFATFIGL
jgi:hypothetical protein